MLQPHQFTVEIVDLHDGREPHVSIGMGETAAESIFRILDGRPPAAGDRPVAMCLAVEIDRAFVSFRETQLRRG